MRTRLQAVEARLKASVTAGNQFSGQGQPGIRKGGWYLVDVSGETKSGKSEIFAGPFSSETLATKYKNGNGHGDDEHGGISAEVMRGADCIANGLKWSFT